MDVVMQTVWNWQESRKNAREEPIEKPKNGEQEGSTATYRIGCNTIATSSKSLWIGCRRTKTTTRAPRIRAIVGWG
ncbi:unnamed protein product [Haemonchus placei]|uniref:Uncharacterized protein n=1 Tax=Haemonchus placei TaxID=6290 RepID=A0A0N4WI63_HAEPC|nr:unnamed protein product [Haemonchus placei]